MEEYRLIVYRPVYSTSFSVTGAGRVRRSARLWVCSNGVWMWL